MLLGYSFIILLMAILTSQFSFSQFDQVGELNDRMVENIFNEIKFIDTLERDFFEIDKTSAQLQLTKDIETLNKLINRLQTLSTDLNTFRNISQEGSLFSFLNTTIGLINEYIN